MSSPLNENKVGNGVGSGEGYQAIDASAESSLHQFIKHRMEWSQSESTQSWSRLLTFRNICLLVVASVILSFSVMKMRSPGSSIFLRASNTCRSCTFTECQRKLCPLVAPQVCVKGAARDGCGSTPAAWIGNSVCDECCDSSKCAATTPSGDDDTLTLCAKCTFSQCLEFKDKCYSSSAPYVCTDGGAKYGCTKEKYHWPSALNGICNSCCDISTCK